MAAVVAAGCGGEASARDDVAPGAAAAESATAGQRAIAITVDDLPAVSTRRDLETWTAITDGILAALDAHDAHATGFVNENKLEADGVVDTARVALLRRWLERGHELGNHTFSHPDLHAVPLAAYQADIAKGDVVTRRLLAERGAAPRWFRHPFLRTGRDLETRRAVETFLAERGYRVAPVTVDNAEYVFARALDHALDARDDVAAARIGDAYLAYMDTVFGFYEAQARTILGYEPPQVLLLHANRLNARYLDPLLDVLGRRGYRFTTLEDAVRDPAYARADEYTGPAGITWLHRWALTAGLRGAAFAGEPEVPAWIAAAADGRLEGVGL